MNSKKPYAERTDLEKIHSQWKKISGLLNRKEWSSAVVRAATAAEIATNFAIRNEFSKNSSFDDYFIDSLLMWANGINGKFKNILAPLHDKKKTKNTYKKLGDLSAKINTIRNSVVHKGEFCNEDESMEAVKNAKTYIEELVNLYHDEKFAL
jgi:hypothetical protein